jgi:hypothetical protein
MTADQAHEEGQVWISSTSRFQKMEYLLETCSEDFIKNHLLDEMVLHMGEEVFDSFFRKLKQNWGIMTPPELDYEMNS